MATQRTSRVFTISLPPELAQKAEALAQRDSRTMSELFRESFRLYCAQDARQILQRAGEYAETLNCSLTEEDVPRAIKEVREEASSRRSSRVHS
jgi:CopG family transcriptional regulator/antitoxin EndoAI